MKTFIRGHKVQVWGLNRLQELGIFHENTETKQKTSKMGFISVKIWFHLETYSRKKMGKTDGLSKRLDWKVGVEKNNKNQIFIRTIEFTIY